MSSDEHQGGFFQFPLCLLAQAVTFENLLELCLGYGVCHFLNQTLGGKWRDTAESRDFAMQKARETIRFSGGRINDMLAHYTTTRMFEQEWQQLGRNTCYVRMRKDFYFDTLEHQVLSERDWRVLAAIYSAIGDKPVVELGWQRIQWRAAGWLTKASGRMQPCGRLYPRGQIERTLAKLLERKFVFAATYRRGERYWSHRLDQEGIWAEIATRKQRSSPDKRKQIDAVNSAALYAKLHPPAIQTLPGFFPAGKRLS